MAIDSVTFLDSSGDPVAVGVLDIQGVKAPLHVLCDGTGLPYGSANPVLMAPAISKLVPNDYGGAIAAQNTLQQVIAANSNRKGGWIQADPGNGGYIRVRLIAGSANFQSVLGPGASCPLTLNGGVIQTEVDVAGDTAGDKFLAVELV